MRVANLLIWNTLRLRLSAKAKEPAGMPSLQVACLEQFMRDLQIGSIDLDAPKVGFLLVLSPPKQNCNQVPWLPWLSIPAGAVEIRERESRKCPSLAFISRNRLKFDDITTPGLRCRAGGKGALLVR